MPKRRTFSFDGLGVSAGIVIGPAFVLEPTGYEVESREISPEDVDAEVERFQNAIDAAEHEINELTHLVRERLDDQQAAILEAHATLLRDPLLYDKTVNGIRTERRNAEHIYWSVTKDIGQQLKGLGDAYFSERSHDLYDIARRVLKFLSQLQTLSEQGIPRGSIIVAPDLGPSETAQMQRDRISGFCTNSGGATSHTAIMAKALGIPAVVGLEYITHYARNGDLLILDGTNGKVILNPNQEQIDEYREKAEVLARAREELETLRELPAETVDGHRVKLVANIEFSREVTAVLSQGAEGVGLYRTEYFFIERSSLPTEDEQEEDYRAVLESMGDLPVVFRTLDVGGDKISDAVATPRESNPFLGLRALRLCLAHPELFRRQLRPMMRAANGRELRLLLPMVSGIDEVRQAKSIIFGVRDNVKRLERLAPSSIVIGAMIEIPSAAIMAERLAAEVDFFSIGTNDLVQYTLAVDRINKMVGHLYQELHPAVLHLIHHTVQVARKTGTPVTVCGEMAGNPTVALLLLGLGIRSLSMSPSLISTVKQAIRRTEMAALEELAGRLLSLQTAAEIGEALVSGLARIAARQSASGKS